MAKLVLDENEYTVEGLLRRMKLIYHSKSNGVPFSQSDIHDWATKRRIPKLYGGQFIATEKVGPLKVLRLSDTPFENQTVQKIDIETKSTNA